MKYATSLCLLFLVVMAPLTKAEPSSKPDPRAIEFFEKSVRPILVEHCFSCHGPEKQRAGLRLDSRAALLKGTETSPVVVSGDPEKSLLVKAIHYQGEPKMPPKQKLPPDAIDALTAWVKMGLPWPESSTTAAENKPMSIAEARKKHWAFQPIRLQTIPAIKDRQWARNPIDFFILAKLEATGRRPSPPAEPRTLLRRLYLDVIGLPPTPEETEAFVKDHAVTPQDAIAKAVDRLLASPHYGERWGRHWLDVARYADTKGYVFEEERRYPFAYTYRDYVIRSFNEDLPYDQFVLHQLAADQLPLGDDKRPLAAMGYLTLGRRFLNNIHDIIDDRLDVVGRGLLGLTISCARCHDHKFDPIPTKDYYSLYGVFASSSEPKELPTISEPTPSPEYQAFEKELKTLQEQVKEFEQANQAELKAGNRKARDELRRRQKKVEELKVTHPGSPAQAMVLVDSPTPMQPQVFLRGNPNNRGESVPRQFLQVLSEDKPQPFRQGSGRLELARAIASRDNPLTARVLVNRIWLHHFGAGLVRTPSNFGLRGELPTHPELLDYLAWNFMENGWSIKKLHRQILLSAVYQQASDDPPGTQPLDPDNRLLGKMNRQRLDFETLRDSLLAMSGKLDLRMGGKPVELTTRPFPPRRSVYGFIDRQNLPGLFRTFDFASPDTSSAQRHATTVPQQALFLMNSPFVVEQAKNLIARPDVAALQQPEQRIERLYRLLFARGPEREELALGKLFLETAASSSSGLSPWEQYAQVLLLSNEFAFMD